MIDLKTLKNKVILFGGSLWIVDDIRDECLLMSKLESGAEMEEFDFEVFDMLKFDFEDARLKAVDVMNQVRFFDNVLTKERDNVVL